MNNDLNWLTLGIEMAESAMDAHEGYLPNFTIGYDFMLENPECFGREEWPGDMPKDAPVAFRIGYYARVSQ